MCGNGWSAGLPHNSTQLSLITCQILLMDYNISHYIRYAKVMAMLNFVLAKLSQLRPSRSMDSPVRFRLCVCLTSPQCFSRCVVMESSGVITIEKSGFLQKVNVRDRKSRPQKSNLCYTNLGISRPKLLCDFKDCYEMMHTALSGIGGLLFLEIIC